MALVNVRGNDLMNKANRQLAEATQLVDRLSDATSGAPCPGESADGAGRTLGAVAGHLAEGYARLRQFLQAGGYLLHVRRRDFHDHAAGEHDGAGRAPESVPDLLDRLAAGKASVGLLADLTDQQLDRVSDVLEAAISHQAEHVAALKRAVR